MARQAIHLRIEGHVQGVGFRNWVRGQAHRLDLCGWVRNRLDRTVEVLAIGEPSALRALEAVCKRGPMGSRVDTVHSQPATDDGARDFEKRETV